MRDPKRIKPFCEKIEEVWNKYPDLRFCQLIKIISINYNTDFFYIEDEKIEKQLDKIIEGNELW